MLSSSAHVGLEAGAGDPSPPEPIHLVRPFKTHFLNTCPLTQNTSPVQQTFAEFTELLSHMLTLRSDSYLTFGQLYVCASVLSTYVILDKRPNRHYLCLSFTCGWLILTPVFICFIRNAKRLNFVPKYVQITRLEGMKHSTCRLSILISHVGYEWAIMANLVGVTSP